jgi:hypothetical protein
MQRGCLPDALDKKRVILIKVLSRLHLTNEIKLAAYFAKQTSRALVITLPEKCKLTDALVAFSKAQGIDFLRKKI